MKKGASAMPKAPSPENIAPGHHPTAQQRNAYFFLVVLSLAFTCDPSVGAAAGAALSFLGFLTSLLLRT